jgi:hypothetical protein
MRHALVTLALLAGCDGAVIDETDTSLDPDTGDDTDTDTDVDTTCTATVVSTDPVSGHAAFPVNVGLTATFSEAVTAGQYALSINGVTGSTTLAADGLSATFTPNAPLATSTAYTFTATACASTVTSSFTTAGPPLSNTALDGSTYVLDYDDVTWVAPASAALFRDQIPVEYILLHVIDADTVAETISAVGSQGIEGQSGPEQDPCQEPFDLGTQDFASNPVFRLGPSTFEFDVQGNAVSLDNMRIEALFVEDGAAIEDVVISAEIDTRPLDSFSPLSGDLCTDVGLLGDRCMACASDGAIECLGVILTVDRAERDADLAYNPTLVPDPVACN